VEKVVLPVQSRSEKGSRAIRKLRDKGLIPAVLYGHKKDTLALSMPYETFESAVRGGARMVSLKWEGGEEMALIKEIQHDALGDEVLHVDFYRIAMDELLKLPVSVEIWGKAPGLDEGGILDNVTKELQVECLPTAVPDRIRVDVSALKMGEAIHVKDIKAPEGVKILADPELIVVTVRQPKEEAPPEVTAEAPSEPEVITARKEKPEEEEAEAEEKEAKPKAEKAEKAEGEKKS
jgi:large subunit ribosomal protein L25